MPRGYSLEQNYPNPFNPATNIRFGIPKAGQVKLSVYDIAGRELSVLVNKELSAGSYKTEFNGEQMPSGTYFYKLEADGFTEVKKMILIKSEKIK